MFEVWVLPRGVLASGVGSWDSGLVLKVLSKSPTKNTQTTVTYRPTLVT